MMKKIIDFIKKYWFLSLAIIPLYYVAMQNRNLDNDLWFLLNLGRYIFKNGFPVTDPFTMHEGLKFIAQQWLVDCLFWIMYKVWGVKGILLIVYILVGLLYLVLYKLYYGANGNKAISFILATLSLYLSRYYIVSRPQLFTYLILLTETLLIELYIKNNNKKYLYILPILSILQINLHASMWWFQFVFMIPFIINGIYIKKLTIEKYNVIPIVLIMVPMLLGGLINPYGIDSILYIFKAYGYRELSDMIGEMYPLSFTSTQSKVLLGYIIILILSCNFFKKRKMDIRYLCFMFGTILLVCMHYKSYPYFVFYGILAFAYFYKDIKIKRNIKWLKNKWFILVRDALMYSLALVCIPTLILILYCSFKVVFLDNDASEVGEYLQENYDTENIVVYTDFNTGQYFEFLGYKAYIDGRAELFYEKYNEKEDIMPDFYKILKNDFEFDYDEFMDKYQFDLIVVPNTIQILFDRYLEKNEQYKLVYIEYYDTENEEDPIYKVYERTE